ncbi:MAG: hypothetical protein ABSD42_00120 [Candidatus Bathyarchaeia archaeon]|jgi:hypothetical protein
MGKCTVTKGQRRLGRTIRKLEGSVELSAKESKAKEAEKKYKQKTQTSLGYSGNSPIQNLRDPSKCKKEQSKP